MLKVCTFLGGFLIFVIKVNGEANRTLIFESLIAKISNSATAAAMLDRSEDKIINA